MYNTQAESPTHTIVWTCTGHEGLSFELGRDISFIDVDGIPITTDAFYAQGNAHLYNGLVNALAETMGDLNECELLPGVYLAEPDQHHASWYVHTDDGALELVDGWADVIDYLVCM